MKTIKRLVMLGVFLGSCVSVANYDEPNKWNLAGSWELFKTLSGSVECDEEPMGNCNP